MQATVWALTIFIVVASCLEARIELTSSSYSTGGELNVNWRLTHYDSEPLDLLRWGTPLEGTWNANFFEINHIGTGSNAVYAGKLVKRATPTDEHYLRFNTEATHNGMVNLASGYRFYSAGTYTVTLLFTAQARDGSLVRVKSNSVTVLVVNPDVREQVSHHESRTIGFVGCDAAQQNIILNAESLAQVGVDSINLYMSQTLPPACSTNYVEWFGTYSVANWNTIQGDYLNMRPLLHSDVLIFDCSDCIGDPNYSSTFAYVYPPDATHTIYFCGAFWNAPAGPYQTDSQAGTIVHELSHFVDVAATSDFAYGQTLCRNLAINNPANAVNNADSHEYMVEAHPVCSISGSTSCGNFFCDPLETNANCPGDCPIPTCGNAICDFSEFYITCPGDCTIPTCGNEVCDVGETLANCPFDCTTGGVGGDPHLFSFDGKELSSDLPFRARAFYSFYTSPSMQIVIRTVDRKGTVLIDGVGITIQQHQFLAVLNVEEDAEFYLNGNLIVDSTLTSFGMLEYFYPTASDLVGPLAELSRYVEVGVKFHEFFTVVAGYHPGFGGFFNLAVHQSDSSASGLLASVSRNHDLRDVSLDEFETTTFF